jgi:hypothetical protein
VKVGKELQEEEVVARLLEEATQQMKKACA